MHRSFSTILIVLCLCHEVMSTPLDGTTTFKTSSSRHSATSSSRIPSLGTSSSTQNLSNGKSSTGTTITSTRPASSAKTSSKSTLGTSFGTSLGTSSRISSGTSSRTSSGTSVKTTSRTSIKPSSIKTSSTTSSSSTASTNANPPASTLDDYDILTVAQKQQIAFDVSINFATQLAMWDFQACVRYTLGWSCELSYQQRTLDSVAQEFRPLGNYDTFPYDAWTYSQYYGFQASDLSNTTFVSYVTDALLMGCLGNITCQTEFAQRPNVYTRVTTDLVQSNVDQIAAQLSNDRVWIPTGSNAKYLKRFAAYPDYTGEIFGIHSAIPLAILAGYVDKTAFGAILQMDRIMTGYPLRLEDSINTVALLGLQITEWANVNKSVLGNIYKLDKALLNKRTEEVDWFNVDPTKLLKQMNAPPELDKRDSSALDQIRAICSGIGLATNLMSIRGIAKTVVTKIRPRPTIATFDNAFGAYASSENLVLSTITDACAQHSSICYGGSHFWQYANVAGDAVDIIAGYIGLAAAATAAVGLTGGAAVVGGVEIALNTLNLGCALSIYAADVAQAVMLDCQKDSSLPECASLNKGCLFAGSIRGAFGVAA